MKKIIALLLTVATAVTCAFALTACKKSDNEETIVCFTNAYFAPFEYFDGTDIKGVDIDIMNKVGEKLGKKIVYENKDFSTLIDYVAEGKLCDCAAAGFTITESRKEKVDFSVEYYTSVQYVIFKKGDIAVNAATDGTQCVFWEQLGGKKIGVQLDTTGNIYVDGEINGWDEETPGVIQNTGAACETLDDAQLAFSKLKAGQIDCVVVDELPAKYLIKNETEYVAYALYYDADTATEEKYGIAVNKNQPELLKAINEVLNELLASKNEDGENGVEQLVKKHFGI
ncbi:MAG: ABC transporter substrate-binding protein [Christensenellaceae bacterium]|nr:ABC transporter substrate-binding protein [Christensenellaceae bacterium]